VVGFTTGSRGAVPGKRKPVIREHDDDDDDDNNNNHISIITETEHQGREVGIPTLYSGLMKEWSDKS
jgi:hypothetical protein